MMVCLAQAGEMVSNALQHPQAVGAHDALAGAALQREAVLSQRARQRLARVVGHPLPDQVRAVHQDWQLFAGHASQHRFERLGNGVVGQ